MPLLSDARCYKSKVIKIKVQKLQTLLVNSEQRYFLCIRSETNSKGLSREKKLVSSFTSTFKSFFIIMVWNSPLASSVYLQYRLYTVSYRDLFSFSLSRSTSNLCSQSLTGDLMCGKRQLESSGSLRRNSMLRWIIWWIFVLDDIPGQRWLRTELPQTHLTMIEVTQEVV